MRQQARAPRPGHRLGATDLIGADQLFELLGLPTGDPAGLTAGEAGQLAALEQALHTLVRASIVRPIVRANPDDDESGISYRMRDVSPLA